VSLGWYESELIRHADPASRTLGRYFSEEIAAPLGLNFWIGLPASVDRNRIANLHTWSRAEALLHVNTMPPGFVVGLLNPFRADGSTTAANTPTRCDSSTGRGSNGAWVPFPSADAHSPIGAGSPPSRPPSEREQ
jgi:hypothetical protein